MGRIMKLKSEIDVLIQSMFLSRFFVFILECVSVSDPIDIKDMCLSINVSKLHPGQPYHFKWLDHDLYLFLNEEETDDKDIINIYVTED